MRGSRGRKQDHSRRVLRIFLPEVVSRKKASERDQPRRRRAAESRGLDLGRQSRACVPPPSPAAPPPIMSLCTAALAAVMLPNTVALCWSWSQISGHHVLILKTFSMVLCLWAASQYWLKYRVLPTSSITFINSVPVTTLYIKKLWLAFCRRK